MQLEQGAQAAAGPQGRRSSLPAGWLGFRRKGENIPALAGLLRAAGAVHGEEEEERLEARGHPRPDHECRRAQLSPAHAPPGPVPGSPRPLSELAGPLRQGSLHESPRVVRVSVTPNTTLHLGRPREEHAPRTTSESTEGGRSSGSPGTGAQLWGPAGRSLASVLLAGPQLLRTLEGLLVNKPTGQARVSQSEPGRSLTGSPFLKPVSLCFVLITK